MASSPARPRVYLAGPQVFLPDAEAAGRALVAICAEHGLEGLFPLDAETGLDALAAATGPEQAGHIFRGVSADVGTAWELGFAFGLGLPLFGYTTVAEHYRDRVAAGDHAAAGERVEDFDLADNLMLESSILASGGLVVRGAESFVACVALAAASLQR